MYNQSKDERTFYRGVLAMLVLTGFTATAGAVLHYVEPNPELMDLIIPPLVAIANLLMVFWLLQRPQHVLNVVYSAFGVAIFALSLPAWYFTWQATHSANVLLTHVFPPISSFFVILIVVLMVLLPPRRAFAFILIVWSLNAIPILGYLLTHKEELWTPRGREMFMSYGLAIFLLLILLPFQRRARMQLQRLQHANFQMHNLAERDALTQQYNRWGGQRLLDEFMRSRTVGSVIMLDIDHFKPINDTHGHVVGDKVLQQFSERLSSALRSDGHLIRWGGEEFLVLILGITEQDAVKVAERLRAAISNDEFPVVGKLTVSGGVTSRRENDSLESLITRADKCLYEAKLNGRNQIASE